jgi:hypothetical protein
MALARTPELDRRTDLALWFGVMAPPLGWVFQHQMSMILTPWVCRTGNHWALLPVALVGLASSAAGGLVAWRHFQPTPPEEIEHGPAPEFRRRFMAGAGLLLALLFFLGALAVGVADAYPAPCR